VDFVGGESVPDNELAVLRGTNEVARIRGPVHSIDFTKVTLEDSSLFDRNRDLLNTLLSGQSGQWLINGVKITTEVHDLILEALDIAEAAFNLFFYRHFRLWLSGEEEKRKLLEKGVGRRYESFVGGIVYLVRNLKCIDNKRK